VSPIKQTLRAIRRHVVRKVRQVGFVGAVRHGSAKCLRELPSFVSPVYRDRDSFDAEHGTDTEGIVGAATLDVPDVALEHTNRYEAVAAQTFFSIMRELHIAHEQFVFVDMGCGKGRALLLAASFPFKQVVGVDISAILTGVALKNVKTFKGEPRRCEQIHLVCTDASSYELPLEKLVVFFYNPFDEHIMRLVLTNIEKSLHEFPRKIYVLYHHPVHRSLWDASAEFHQVNSAAGHVLYESIYQNELSVARVNRLFQDSVARKDRASSRPSQ
jgi:SAM-dependent methyltransferase